MKMPTMDELRQQEQGNEGLTAFNYEVAFYHGWMAALSAMGEFTLEKNIERLRDIANSSMAEEMGG